MIYDYPLKREALSRLIRQARHAHTTAPVGDQKDAAGTWLDLLTGIDEDLIRAHQYRDIAIEREPAPIPRNKGGRPRTRNPITAAALN